MDRLTQIEQRVAESRPVLRSDVRVLVETLREVEALHRRREFGAGQQVCETCHTYTTDLGDEAEPWPCPTAAAVQELGGGS